MPDEISHILWTYLLLAHPRIEGIRDMRGWRGKAATYFFAILPDLWNLGMILGLVWIMQSNSLPLVMGPAAMQYPQVREAFSGTFRNIYYVFHSYVTYAILLAFFYFILRRIYWPLALGMLLHITIDIPTHKDYTALEPFYPLSTLRINGLVHWGSWEFYITELLLVIVYTIWLYRTKRQASSRARESGRAAV